MTMIGKRHTRAERIEILKWQIAEAERVISTAERQEVRQDAARQLTQLRNRLKKLENTTPPKARDKNPCGADGLHAIRYPRAN